ncbi:MAG: hypothetical protein AAF656_09965, partial [Planctomycetota bacterium]
MNFLSRIAIATVLLSGHVAFADPATGAAFDSLETDVTLDVSTAAEASDATFATIDAALNKAVTHLERGESVTVRLSAGTFREPVARTFLPDSLAAQTLLVIEGAGAGET